MANEFYKLISEAVNDIAQHGYDTETRVKLWLDRIAAQAALTLTPIHVVELALRRELTKIYQRQISPTAVKRHQKSIPRFTVERLKPKLREELDRRIAASANLIKLNRRQAIETTLRRFSGWATSVPAGGSKAVNKAGEAQHVRKALAQLSFVDRRVAIDQGHKLASAINEVLAVDGGAIAAVWHSHWRQPNYDYRPDHKERDQQVYLIRSNWAQAKGLVRAGLAGYYDKITKPGEEVFCRCWATYLHALTDLPSEMLTAKGRAALEPLRLAS